VETTRDFLSRNPIRNPDKLAACVRGEAEIQPGPEALRRGIFRARAAGGCPPGPIDDIRKVVAALKLLIESSAFVRSMDP
jgi:hypothetical protein